jgi:hypothetical protein
MLFGQTDEENARTLRGEFENLVQGEAFQDGFEELALEYGTFLPRTLFHVHMTPFPQFHHQVFDSTWPMRFLDAL